MPQMAEKASPDAPPNCAVVPKEKKLQKHIAVEMRSSWGAKKGSRGNPPCGVKGRSSLVGFGATPQLFLG